MARIRSVHPGLFTDEAWVSCSPLARLLIIGLWTDADDQGVFEWKPLQIKMRLLPGDMAEAAPLLSELERAGLVRRFETAGKVFGAIRNFRRFQRPKKPNSIHPITDAIRIYVALDAAGSEPDDDEPEAVPHQFPTSGEIVPQMEDVGGRREEGIEANASLVADSDEEALFEAAWNAYPHAKGRSSRVKSRAAWGRISLARRQALPAGAARYRAEGREPKEDCGAPAFEKWLKDQRFLDWIEGPPAVATAWAGPADLRATVVAQLGEGFARSWLDPCTWQDVPTRTLAPKTNMAADRLQRDAGDLIAAAGIEIIRRAA